MKVICLSLIVASLVALQFSNDYAKLGVYKQCLKGYNIIEVEERLSKAKSKHSIQRLNARIDQLKSICKQKAENKVLL